MASVAGGSGGSVIVPGDGGGGVPVGELRAFYISATGDDSTGDGSILNPWSTVGKFVASSPIPGDVLRCRGGTYTGTSRATATGISGTAANPITVCKYPAEAPVFQGSGSGGADQFLQIEDGSSYWTVDGLTFQNFRAGSSGVVWIGDASTSTHHNTVRSCTFHALAGGTSSEQQIYLSYHADDATVEGNVFIGASVGGDGGTAVNIGDHDPAPERFLVQRNVMTGFGDTGAMWVNGTGGTTSGSILHNTFLDSVYFIRLVNTTDVIVRNNAGETAAIVEIDDTTYYDGGATMDHNFWGQTIGAAPGYAITSGSGIGAASDGGDAGWQGGL